LGSHNQFIQALALVSIGNLATQDMARDVASDVEKLLRSNNSYLRKKAALAVIRLVKKEPDLIEHMTGNIVALLKDKTHGVLISGLQLMIDVLELVPTEYEEYGKLVPALVRLLRNLISMGFSPEHDVGGITDPFVQVKLLHLLRLLGKGREDSSELMNDVLAQVATNTDTAKNAGNAILYECVQTIMEVESEASLRVLAVNILGRFLLNRDNNIRYVALNSLSKVVSEDIAAVQRHRTTIVECLKDPDISIRQRAVELVFQLVNEQNVVALTEELIAYLVSASSDQKGEIVSNIMSEILEKFSPTRKWRVDSIISMLSVAGNQCDDIVPRTAIIFISQAKGLQGYAVHRLYRSLEASTSQLGLVHVGIWCIGEFGDLLVNPSNSVDPEVDSFPAVPAESAIDLLDSCLRIHNTDVSTKALVLSSLMKLSTRLAPAYTARIAKIIGPFRSSMNLELQQRGIEYSNMLTTRWDSLRGDVLGKMPVIDEASFLRRKYGSTEEAQKSGVKVMSGVKVAPVAEVSLLDLDDIFGGPSSSSTAPAPATRTSLSGGLDLLDDIFSSISVTPTPMQHMQHTMPLPIMSQSMMSQPTMPPPTMLDPFMSVMPEPFVPAMPEPIEAVVSKPLNMVIYDSDNIQISFEVTKPAPNNLANTRIVAQFVNKSAEPVSNFMFQV
jgi:AP-1 complex subunit gamma-1